jgi:hypothetical protein
VIVHFDLGGEAMGTGEQQVEFFDMEDRLIRLIATAGVGEYDGNEFGMGEAVAYAYGPDADALFAAMQPELASFAARPAYAVLRYGPAGDPGVRQRRIDIA